MNLFSRKKYVSLPISDNNIQPNVPDGIWVQCKACKKMIYKGQMGAYKVCPSCGYNFRLTAHQMKDIILDKESFTETNAQLVPKNHMDYPNYPEKIENLGNSLDIKEAVLTGFGKIDGIDVAICIMDSHFIMGSMGSVVGEKITQSFEAATEKNLPILIFTASGGARMQEGIISLMQMAKISSAAKKHAEKGLLYITVVTDPTTGGVTASFASLGDIILAEPKSILGFAGRRVIEQTIKDKLPEDFQSTEFVLEHGFVDAIVNRADMRKTLANVLKIHRDNINITNLQEFRKIEQIERIEPYKAVQIARKLDRPSNFSIINHIITDFVELHGDRGFGDDRAIIGGIGYLQDMPITVIATQKGSNLEQNLSCNFGQPHPEGYRKALRIMKQAEKFGRPILTLINTSGAYPGEGAETRGQGSAIAQNLYEMSSLKVPIIAVITGEGGSGGALALALSDRVFMFEYSIYSILSPEGFASILWKDGKRAREAAELMKLTSVDLKELGVVEDIIPEATGGFQDNPQFSLNYLKSLIVTEFKELLQKNEEELLQERYNRFRKFGL